MGLLDSLLSGGSGGGLLDFLRNNALNQQFSSGLPSDQAQYGSPISAMAQAQPNPAMMQPSVPQQPPPVIQAQPMQAPQAQQPMQPQGPGFGDHLMAGLQGFANSGGLIPAIANGITGLATGQRNDPQGIAQQGQNLTRQWLMQHFDPVTANAAIANPAVLSSLIKQMEPKALISTGSGHLYDPNLKQDIKTYEPEDKFQHVTVKDANGAERPATFDPSSGKYTFPEGVAAPAPTGPVTMEDLQKSDPAMASQVQSVLDGRVPYPTGSRLNPKQQNLKEAVTQIDPTFDATTSRTRAKFNMEFGSTSPSTVGGQKILMGTALGHLGEVADSAAGLHNSDGGGIAMFGHGANAIKNMTTENAAKANALEDKVAKFSGEVGKLYSGSQGGGVHEREDTRHRMGSTLTSAELASGLEASRDLILSKQKALEDQAVTIFGPDKAAKYDFIGPDGRKSLDKIENAIVKLRGGNGAAPSAATPAPTSGEGAIAHNPKTGETIIRKDGKWVPYS